MALVRKNEHHTLKMGNLIEINCRSYFLLLFRLNFLGACFSFGLRLGGLFSVYRLFLYRLRFGRDIVLPDRVTDFNGHGNVGFLSLENHAFKILNILSRKISKMKFAFLAFLQI